jgi:hypothetical protein
MPFFPLIQSAGSAAPNNQTPRADDGRRPGAAPDPESVQTGFGERHAMNARAGSPYSQLLTAEIHADVPMLCLDAPASAKSSLARASHKSIPPRNAGALGGRLQQRSGVQTQFWSIVLIGDSLLQVNQNCEVGADGQAVSLYIIVYLAGLIAGHIVRFPYWIEESERRV